MTQFGRVLAELQIEVLCANSSQAKGRVERANRKLQDRLVKALRLADISTIDHANRFLPAFMAGFNDKFAKTPAKDHAVRERSTLCRAATHSHLRAKEDHFGAG